MKSHTRTEKLRPADGHRVNYETKMLELDRDGLGQLFTTRHPTQLTAVDNSNASASSKRYDMNRRYC